MRNELLKKELEKICKIHKWNPSDNELDNIRREYSTLLAQGRKLRIGDCQQVISKHCPDAILMICEGADNSDLNSLLKGALNK
jgi:hypothetical protein